MSIQIWDTCSQNILIIAGAERYRAITTNHMRNADGVILVYDITSEKSFKMLQFWYDSVKMSTGEDIVIYLLGNKSDLKLKKNYKNEKFDIVPTQKAITFVKDYNLHGYVECSAKENINISDSFKTFYKSNIIPRLFLIDRNIWKTEDELRRKNKKSTEAFNW